MTKDINKKPFDDKTLLKLDIFRECFQEWIPVHIHNSFIDKVFVLDLFSGSGTDSEGNFGSPLLLIDVIGENKFSYCKTKLDKLQFWFNDNNKSKIIKLKSEIEKHCESCCNKE